MTKQEFEKRFLEIIKQKINLKAGWENALKDLLRFVDNHKIYEFRTYEDILESVRNVKFLTNCQGFLDKSGYKACYHNGLNVITVGKKFYDRQNYCSTLVHELIHAISSDYRVEYDCMNFKKETRPDLYDFSAYFPTTFSDSVTEDDILDRIGRWWEINGRLMEDAKTSRPIRVEYLAGFNRYEIEYSENLTPQKTNRLTTCSNDIDSYFLGRLKNSRFNYNVTSPSKGGPGIHEGTTELIAKLCFCLSSHDNSVRVDAYRNQTMIAYQLYCVFGDKLFEGYFTHSLEPMKNYLGLKNPSLEKIFNVAQQIKNASSATTQRNLELMQVCQLDILKLFERKMLRELAQYQHYFSSPMLMRRAILSSFADFSKVAYFGMYDEEQQNAYQDVFWEKYFDCLNRTFEFGNKLLMQQRRPSMAPITPKNISTLKDCNFASYAYLSSKQKEITLKDRLALEQIHSHPVVSNDKRYLDAKKLGTEILPGEISYMRRKNQ